NPGQPIEVGRQDGTTILINEKRLPDGGSVLVISDITEIKNSQQQILQASKLATLGEMATGMAHELNQPLNVIRMAADSTLERVEEGDFDADYLRGKLERISAQIDRNHLLRHGAACGQFGFIEAIDDGRVFAGLFAVVSTAQTVGLVGSEALFLARVGVGQLPLAFVIASAITVSGSGRSRSNEGRSEGGD
ncbi:MAG: PAS-domain containing protein, partial [Planctomycetes bacterium]|nr:PAS-domain containing protein [Planctomycetota bacterium]